MSKLKASSLTSIVLLLTSVFCVQSAPAKPLNERSKELTWQAWLLVDDQNQNKQYDADGLLKRRITPKSVFIAPTFSPESLPECADGYASDAMGRCVKLIQLDEDAHLIYILERLKQQYGNFTDDYYDEDDGDEEKPTPGPVQFNIPLEEVADSGEDANVAIVVAPTNGNFNLSDPAKNDTQMDAPIIITRIQINDEVEETTTAEATTVETTTAEAETTTTALPGEGQAIFFKLPTNDTKASDEPIAAEDRPAENFVRYPQDEPMRQLPPHPDQKTSFNDNTEELISHLLPHANVKTQFDSQKLFEEAAADSHHLFKNRDTTHQSTEPAAHQMYNHRNRDKWLFPPTWRDSPPQKPLVLRFNKSQGGHLHHHHPRQSDGVYREVPPEDLSYIFGFRKGAAHR